MRVAVLGAKGMLGRYVSQHLTNEGFDVFEITRDDIDASNFNEYTKLNSLIESADTVINCIGTIKPVANVQSKEATFMVNSIFPNYLSRVCSDLGINCYHITTDCVYSGDTGKYSEDDLCDVYDDYGFSKSLGDLSLCHVIRTSIIGEELENKRSLLEWAKSQAGKEVNGFTNHYWNGVTCLQLAKILQKLIITDTLPIQDKGFVNIRHFFSNPVSKFELLQMISDSFDLNLHVVPVEATTYCDRTLSSIFNKPTHILRQIPPLNEQLDELAGFYG